MEEAVLAIHDEQIAEHGGAPGLRDLALLRSALARPQDLAAYETPDAAALAAAYFFGITRNHPFTDGDKRTAFIAANVFLLDNGYDVTAPDPEIVRLTLSVAAGDTQEPEPIAWLHTSTKPI
jgi:death-on-curing protein